MPGRQDKIDREREPPCAGRRDGDGKSPRPRGDVRTDATKRRLQPPNCKSSNAASTALEALVAGESEPSILGEPALDARLAPCSAFFAADARRTDLTFATGATGAYRNTACPVTEPMAATDMIDPSRSKSAGSLNPIRLTMSD
jgi:hypothetical protein